MSELAVRPPAGPAAGDGPPPARRGPSLPVALARRWYLMLVPALVLAAAGVVIGLKVVDPTYTAEAQINVGRLDVTTQALPGFATAAQNLTTGFAQIVETQSVIDPAARRLGTSRADLSDRVTADPINKSSLIFIQATAGNPRAAERAANAVAAVAVKVIGANNDTSARRTQLLRRYRALLGRLDTLRQKLGELGAVLHSKKVAPEDERRFRGLTIDREQLRLRARSVARDYQQLTSGTGATLGLRVVTRADDASSDRTKTAAELGGAGLAGGLALGFLLALLSIRRSRRRHAPLPG